MWGTNTEVWQDRHSHGLPRCPACQCELHTWAQLRCVTSPYGCAVDKSTILVRGSPDVRHAKNVPVLSHLS